MAILKFDFVLVVALAGLTTAIFGAGSFSSDAATWVRQWIELDRPNDNFPAFSIILFNLMTTEWGYLWHFNFLQNLILYFGFFLLVKEMLLLGEFGKALASLISLSATWIFFLNPIVMAHTSKWYMDYLFTGLLLTALFCLIRAVRVRQGSYFLGFVTLFLAAMSLRYNGTILLPCLFGGIYLYSQFHLQLTPKQISAVFFVLLVTHLGIKSAAFAFLDQTSSSYHLTAPFYETLGLIKNDDDLGSKIVAELQDIGINLQPALDNYTAKTCAIPSLHTSSFRDILDQPERFYRYYTDRIVTGEFMSLLKVKLIHFRFFILNQNGCAFSNDLRPSYENYLKNPIYLEIFDRFGTPWKSMFPSLESYLSDKAQSFKKDKFANFAFVNQLGGFVLATCLILAIFGLQGPTRFSICLTAIFLVSLIYCFSFLIFNLGAFEKYGFASLVLNKAIVFLGLSTLGHPIMQQLLVRNV